MTRRYLIYMLLLGSMAAPAADDPGGWTRAKWGMTDDQLLAAFPGEAVRLAKPDSVNHAAIAIERVDLGGVAVKVFLASDVINMLPAEQTDAAFQLLQELLVQAYGRPWKSEESNVTQLQWTFPTTIITLTRAKLPGAPTFRIVTLQYKRKPPSRV